jgi:hypothetical protein
MATTKTERLLRRRTEQISFLSGLTTGDSLRLDDPDSPPWFQEGKIHEVSRSTYQFHAESDSVKWADGSKFVFAIDRNPFQFFWRVDGQFFGRQLNEEQTFRFCQLFEVNRFISESMNR